MAIAVAVAVVVAVVVAVAGRQRGGGDGNVRALVLAHLCGSSRVALLEEGHWQRQWCRQQR